MRLAATRLLRGGGGGGGTAATLPPAAAAAAVGRTPALRVLCLQKKNLAAQRKGYKHPPPAPPKPNPWEGAPPPAAARRRCCALPRSPPSRRAANAPAPALARVAGVAFEEVMGPSGVKILRPLPEGDPEDAPKRRRGRPPKNAQPDAGGDSDASPRRPPPPPTAAAGASRRTLFAAEPDAGAPAASAPPPPPPAAAAAPPPPELEAAGDAEPSPLLATGGGGGRRGGALARNPGATRFRVHVFWDLDNKHPDWAPPGDVVGALRAALSPYGAIASLQAFGNPSTFSHIPTSELARRREQRALEAAQAAAVKGQKRGAALAAAGDAHRCDVCGRRCASMAELKKHFDQLHGREHKKRLGAPPKIARKYAASEKAEKFREARGTLFLPPKGINLGRQLAAAGVEVRRAGADDQAVDRLIDGAVRATARSVAAAPPEARRREQHVIALVSDDGGFAPLLRACGALGFVTLAVCEKRAAAGFPSADATLHWPAVLEAAAEAAEAELAEAEAEEAEAYDPYGFNFDPDDPTSFGEWLGLLPRPP